MVCQLSCASQTSATYSRSAACREDGHWYIDGEKYDKQKHSFKCLDEFKLDRSLTYAMDTTAAAAYAHVSAQSLTIKVCGGGAANGAKPMTKLVQVFERYPLGFQGKLGSSNEALAASSEASDGCVSATVHAVPGPYFLSVAHSKPASNFTVSLECTTTAYLVGKSGQGSNGQRLLPRRLLCPSAR